MLITRQCIEALYCVIKFKFENKEFKVLVKEVENIKNLFIYCVILKSVDLLRVGLTSKQTKKS